MSATKLRISALGCKKTFEVHATVLVFLPCVCRCWRPVVELTNVLFFMASGAGPMALFAMAYRENVSNVLLLLLLQGVSWFWRSATPTDPSAYRHSACAACAGCRRDREGLCSSTATSKVRGHWLDSTGARGLYMTTALPKVLPMPLLRTLGAMACHQPCRTLGIQCL